MNQFYSCLLLNSGIKLFNHFSVVLQGCLKTFPPCPPKSEQAKLILNAIEYISMGLETPFRGALGAQQMVKGLKCFFPGKTEAFRGAGITNYSKLPC